MSNRFASRFDDRSSSIAPQVIFVRLDYLSVRWLSDEY